MAGCSCWALPYGHRWWDVPFIDGVALLDGGQQVFQGLGWGGGGSEAGAGGGVRLAPGTCPAPHLEPPVIASHLGAVSSLPGAFHGRLVEGQPLLQGGLQPQVGGRGLRLWEGPGTVWVVTPWTAPGTDTRPLASLPHSRRAEGTVSSRELGAEVFCRLTEVTGEP